MTFSLLKTTAVAGAMLAASTVGSFAATYAYVDHDALVRYNHSTSSIVVNDVSEGDYVRIIGHWGNWYKIKIDGPDGWVKASVLDFDSYDPYPGPGPSPVQACFWGPLGYVCVNP